MTVDTQGLWIRDEKGQESYVLYSELDDETRQQLIHPVGGFIFSAADFLAMDLPQVPFYIKEWLPKMGKMIIFAPAKSGKSYLCYQIARAIGSGLDVLGLPTMKGKVLYVQFELGEEVLRERLLETRKSYENVWIGTSFALKLDTPEGQEQLRRAVEAVSPDVLILDPLYKAMVGDENESHDVMDALNYLDFLIQTYQCSIILIHHSGKELSKRGRGSSVLEDWVDSYIQMTKVSKDEEVLKIRLKSIFLRHAAPGEPITALFEGFEFVPVEGQNMTIKQGVFNYISTVSHSVTPDELLKLKMGSNGAVYSALKELLEEGKIIRPKTGVYEVKH